MNEGTEIVLAAIIMVVVWVLIYAAMIASVAGAAVFVLNRI